MWAIAVAHGISLDALIAANSQVSDPSQIEVGQVLNIPGRDAPANSAPAANVPPQKEGGGAPAAAPPAPSVLPSLPPPVELNLNNEGFKTVGYFTNWVSLLLSLSLSLSSKNSFDVYWSMQFNWILYSSEGNNNSGQ